MDMLYPAVRRKLSAAMSRPAVVALFYGSILLGMIGDAAVAQTPSPATAPSSTSPAPAPQPAPLTAEALDKLLAPIALYPDMLLAQMLPASAYPLDVVRAHRWIEKNKAAVDKRDFSDADGQSWDVSIKSMVRFPEVIRKMNDDLDWTTDIGEAFVAQPKDVSDSIQRLRRKAKEAGALKPTPEQRVIEKGSTIVIQPAKPDTIYVPQYSSTTVYSSSSSTATAAVIGFGAGVLLGAVIASNNDPWDWNRGYVYPPVWIPPAAYRPGYYPRPPGYNPPGYNPPGYRPGYNPPGYNPPGYGPAVQPWRPDPNRYRPAATPYRPATPVATRPGAPTPAVAPRPAQTPTARPPAGVAPRPAQQPRAGGPVAPQRPAARPSAAPQRTVFDHAGNTGRTDAFKNRGSSSRGAAGLGNRGGGGPRAGGRERR